MAVSQLSVQALLESESLALREIVCRGECTHESAEECAERTYLVFPYRGVYVRHLGGDDGTGCVGPPSTPCRQRRSCVARTGARRRRFA